MKYPPGSTVLIRCKVMKVTTTEDGTTYVLKPPSYSSLYKLIVNEEDICMELVAVNNEN